MDKVYLIKSIVNRLGQDVNNYSVYVNRGAGIVLNGIISKNGTCHVQNDDGYSYFLSNEEYKLLEEDIVSNDDMKVKKIQEKEISLEDYINAQILVNKYLIQYLSRHE